MITGLCSVTNGSPTVTGDGTINFLSYPLVGKSFYITGLNVAYTISAVPTSNTLTLSVNYAGSTSVSAGYNIQIDFTARFGLPIPDPSDPDALYKVGSAISQIDGKLIKWIVITSNTTASVGYGYICDTSGGPFTLTMPATPSVGDAIPFCDGASTWGTNNLTVARNGEKIRSTAADLICDINNDGLVLVYSGSTNGWRET